MEPVAVIVPVLPAAESAVAFDPVGGEACLTRVVDSVLGTAAPAHVAVVTTPSFADAARNCLRPVAPDAAVVVVPEPGLRRQGITAAAERLDVRPDSSRPVLVCDHRYPLSPRAVADRVVLALRGGHDVVVPILPVTDTIKTTDERGSVLGTVDRGALRTVQYPRGFTASALWALVSASTTDDTDEFAVALRGGFDIGTVLGDANAFRIELPRDAQLLDAILADRPH